MGVCYVVFEYVGVVVENWIWGVAFESNDGIEERKTYIYTHTPTYLLPRILAPKHGQGERPLPVADIGLHQRLSVRRLEGDALR